MKTIKNVYMSLLGVGAGVMLLANLSGCVTSSPARPNRSYIDNVPSIKEQLTKEDIEKNRNSTQLAVLTSFEKQANELFKRLYDKNPVLAEELGKIPELQDGISPTDVKALENIVNLYINNNDPEIEYDFQQLLSEGKPEVRKYTTYLRFLFWKAEKEEVDENTLFYIGVFLDDRVSELDFEELTDMINSPKLIKVYTNSHLRYIPDRGHYGQDPKTTFNRKRGDCEDYAVFSAFLLEKAGYEASVLSVRWYGSEGHAVATYKEDDRQLYVLDNKSNSISGPFKSHIEIGNIIAKEEGKIFREIRVFKWKTYPK